MSRDLNDPNLRRIERERAHTTAEAKVEPSNVNVTIKISALWTSMLFVFAYVDLFSLYRPDFRADLEDGEVGGFSVGQPLLLGTSEGTLREHQRGRARPRAVIPFRSNPLEPSGSA
jgi:hypothetical protein